MIDLELEEAILDDCGHDALGIYVRIQSNVRKGVRSTYTILADQSGISERSVLRACQSLELAGYVEVDRGHGRGNKSVVTPVERGVKPDTTGTLLKEKAPEKVHEKVSENLSQKVSEKVHEKVTAPPTPPVVNVNPPFQSSQRDTGVNSPSSPPRRRTTAKASDFPPAMLAFWDAYDQTGRERSSRKQVLGVWSDLEPDNETVAAIMQGVAAWSHSEKWQSGYAPGAHLFLLRRLWEDLPSGSRPRASPPPRNGTDNHAANFAAAREMLNRNPRRTAEPADVMETRGTVR